jgi:hypothetical protein
MTTQRTAISIAPFRQPDGSTQARYTVEFKGEVQPTDAATRAQHIIRASRLDHTERGYLLNCLEIGNFEVAHA